MKRSLSHLLQHIAGNAITSSSNSKFLFFSTIKNTFYELHCFILIQLAAISIKETGWGTFPKIGEMNLLFGAQYITRE